MKKILLLALSVVLIFASCTSKPAEPQTPPAEENVAEAPAETPAETPEESTATETPLKIGVIQLVRHDALDAAYNGFVEGLAEAGYVDGENIVIDLQNAQGEIANTNTIASKLVNDKNDVILAIATPAAQAVANATTDIPVLFTAVTDPVEAGLVDSVEAPGGNITGTSDLTPVADQIDLLKKFVPEAKTIGVIYCSNEPNSEVQARIAKEKIESLGLTYKEFTVSESNQIQQVVTTAVSQVDAIYVPTDNMLASAMVQVSTIATENKIPIIGGEEGQVTNGALASYGVNYHTLGKMTAAQAVKILEGTDPATMPVEYQQQHELSINEETLKQLELTIPEGVK